MTPQQKISLLQKKLEKIKALHPQQSAWFTCAKKWSQGQLDDFENKHGFSLPEDYKEYLLQLGNGGAGKAWHGDCDCGKIRALEEGDLLENIKKPFPLDDKGYDPEMGWMDSSTYLNLGDTTSEDYEECYGLPEGVNYTDGCFRLGNNTDHEGLYLVIKSKNHAGEVWLDCTGYDGEFRPTGKKFLDYCLEDLDEMINN